MKKYVFPLFAISLIALFVSCGSVPSPTLSGVVDAVSKTKTASSAVPASAAAVEFQSGEVLASNDTSKMADATYYVSKVMKPASAETKNQAEALMISDGKKYWVNYVLNSRKATKADFVVGNTVFVLRGWHGHDEISADTYRKSAWVLGNITSTEELFKNNVEVDGEQYNINFVRVPTDPIK